MSARDALTVLASIDGRPVNKAITRGPDGTVCKAMAGNSGRFRARTVPTPDLATLAAVVAQVVVSPDQLLSLSIYPDAPEEFVILPMAVLARYLGCAEKDRDTLAGFHTIPGYNVPVCSRMIENTAHSLNLLIDRDEPADMPDALRALDEGEHDAALDLLFPGYAACGKVRVPSTSGRLIVDGVPPTSTNGHTIVQIADAALLDAKWHQAMLRSLITTYEPAPWLDAVPLAFAKPKHSQTTGEIVAVEWWPIIDRSTVTRGRLVFEGRPDIQCGGVEIAPSLVRRIDGPRLDLAKVPDLSKDEMAAMEEAALKLTGSRPRITVERRQGARGRSPVVNVQINSPMLEWNTAIELRDGTSTTVQALHTSKAGKTRCQAPFRPSDSEAAYFNTHGDGAPFLYDTGTNTKYTLRRDNKPTIRSLCYDRLIEVYDPVRANAIGDAFYSAARGTWVKQREIALDDEDSLQMFAGASDAPEKDGMVKMLALATQVRTWARSAFATLIQQLPNDDDDDAPEAASAARDEEFKQQVGALLKQIVFGSGDECQLWGHGKRAVGTWLHYLAERHPGHWRRFGSHDAMAIINKRGDFKIAMRPELAEQVGNASHAAIRGMTPAKFSKRAHNAGIRDDYRDSSFPAMDGEKAKRWTALTAAFVASLDLATDHRDTAENAWDEAAEALHRAANRKPSGGTTFQ